MRKKRVTGHAEEGKNERGWALPLRSGRVWHMIGQEKSNLLRLRCSRCRSDQGHERRCPSDRSPQRGPRGCHGHTVRRLNRRELGGRSSATSGHLLSAGRWCARIIQPPPPPPHPLRLPGNRSCALILAGRRIHWKPQLTSVISPNKCLFFFSGQWCWAQFSGKLLWQPIGSRRCSQQLHWWGRSLIGRFWMRKTEGSSNQILFYPFLIWYFILTLTS